VRTNIILWLALSFLCAISSIKGQEALTKADSYLIKEEFDQAATEYERAFFYEKNDSIRVIALIKRSYSLKAMNQNYEAYKTLVRVSDLKIGDSLRCVAFYELALNLYLSSYFADAERYCARISALPINSQESKHSVFLHALILNELNRYKQAFAKLNEYCSLIEIPISTRDSLVNFVSNYYSEKSIPSLKSVKKGRRLSKALPGAGLFYAGKPGKALGNIAFQLFALAYTAANVYVGNYGTAATVGFFMIRSFYFGGINQVSDAINKRNYFKTKTFNDNFRKSFIPLLQANHVF
jgi:tetratricopeptide (TPR) repeat protein